MVSALLSGPLSAPRDQVARGSRGPLPLGLELGLRRRVAVGGREGSVRLTGRRGEKPVATNGEAARAGRESAPSQSEGGIRLRAPGAEGLARVRPARVEGLGGIGRETGI